MNKYAILLAFMGLWLFSCRKPMFHATPTAPEIKRKSRQVVKVQNINFQNFRAKGKMDYKDGQNDVNAHYDLRIRKDSLIWLSITPGMGIEVVRCVISKDSLLALDRLNKDYYAYSLADFSAKFEIPLTFSIIQDALIGNTPTDQDTNSSEVFQEGDYTIIKTDTNNLVTNTYVSMLTSKLQKLQLIQKRLNNTLVFTYSDFKPVNNLLVSHRNHIALRYVNEKGMYNTSLDLDHNKIDIDEKELKFPFNIPGKYTRK